MEERESSYISMIGREAMKVSELIEKGGTEKATKAIKKQLQANRQRESLQRSYEDKLCPLFHEKKRWYRPDQPGVGDYTPVVERNEISARFGISKTDRDSPMSGSFEGVGYALKRGADTNTELIATHGSPLNSVTVLPLSRSERGLVGSSLSSTLCSH